MQKMSINKIQAYVKRVSRTIKALARSILEKNVPVELKIGGGSYTDHQKIVVDVSVEEALKGYDNILKCYKVKIAHECSHILYTVKVPYKTSLDTIVNRWMLICKNHGYNVNEDFLFSVACFVLNSVEDGRIEQLLFRRLPYLKPIFKWYRGNSWLESFIEKEETTARGKLLVIENQILVLATMQIKEQGFEENYKGTDIEQFVDSLIPLIYDAITETSCSRACIIYEKICEKLTPYILDVMKDAQETMVAFEENKNLLQRATNPTGFADNESSSEEKESCEPSPLYDDLKASCSSSQEPTETNQDDSSSTNNIREDLMKQLAAAEEQLQQECREINDKIQKEQKQQPTEEELQNALDEMYEESEGNAVDYEEIKKSSNFSASPMVPANIIQVGKVFERQLAEEIKNKSVPNRHRQYSGKLNVKNFYKIATGDVKIFDKKGEPYKVDARCMILKDGSGSMDDRMGNKSKNSMALETLSIIEQGISKLMPLKIEEYASHFGGVEHNVIKDWEDNSMNYSACYKKYTSGGNKDGYTIRKATLEIQKYSEKKKFLIILSDGLPSSYHSTEQGLLDVRTAVQEARKKGIGVISIYFASEDEMNENRLKYEYMYERDYIFANDTNILSSLKKIIKKIVLD